MNIFTEKRTTNNIDNSTEQKTGAKSLVDTLIANGVDTVFGYPGTPMLSVYEELSKTDKIRHILNRHEQASVHSAEGYARLSNKCGVVLTTSGPGFSNTITGIMNANADNTPILVITVHTEDIGQNEFQEVDILNVIKTCTKKSFKITKTEDITRTVSQAIAETTKLPKGVVVVSVTKKALESKSEQKPYKKRHEIKVEAPHSCILKMIDTLKNAKRPLIIVGGGCVDCGVELSEFIGLTHIPVVNTLMAKGIIDDISLGLIGVNGEVGLNNIINSSDVVLALGTRFTDRTTGYRKEFLPKSKIININIEHNKSKNVQFEKEIIGEMKIVLRQIIGVLKSKNIYFDIKYDWIDRLCSAVDDRDLSDEFSAETVIKEIYNYTKKYSPVVVTDVGEHQILTSKLFKTKGSNHFITSGGFGTMGFGLPASIGASIARPNSLVLNITGDGSFQMNMQELATCAEYEIPIKIFIINNSSLEMIKTQQIKNNYSVYQSDLINPDFIKIAQAYGILAYNVSNLDNLKSTLTTVFKYRKPVIINVNIVK